MIPQKYHFPGVQLEKSLKIGYVDLETALKNKLSHGQGLIFFCVLALQVLIVGPIGILQFNTGDILYLQLKICML